MGQKVLLFGRKPGDAARNNFSLIVDKSFQLTLVAVIEKYNLIFRHFLFRSQRIA